VLFLQIGKHGREVVVGQFLPMLEIGHFAETEPPIVDKAAASERLRKETLLFVSRIEPIFVCSLCFTHCLIPFTNLALLYHICQYTNIHAMIDEYELSFIQKSLLCSSPKKGTPLISPCLKPGVLRGGGDNFVSKQTRSELNTLYYSLDNIEHLFYTVLGNANVISTHLEPIRNLQSRHFNPGHIQGFRISS
jgi:hypothetical protein